MGPSFRPSKMGSGQSSSKGLEGLFRVIPFTFGPGSAFNPFRFHFHSRIWVILGLSAILNGCSTPSETPDSAFPPKAPRKIQRSKFNYKEGYRQITESGKNLQGRFASDGRRIIFISLDRAMHSHPQVYEMDLRTKKDRRLTFQDGQNAYPLFRGGTDDFLYASTTDELKEKPRLIKERDNKSPAPHDEDLIAWTDLRFEKLYEKPFEIYFHRMGGSITRLTEAPGFDGDFSLSPSGDIVWISTRRKPFEIWYTPEGGKNSRPVGATSDRPSSPRLSPSNDVLVWIESKKDSEDSRLVLRSMRTGQITPVESPQGGLQTLSWSADGKRLVLSVRTAAAKNWDLFLADLTTGCWTRLLSSPFDELEPQLSPDQQQILFTSNANGEPQLYLGPLPKPSSCEFQGAPLKL